MTDNQPDTLTLTAHEPAATNPRPTQAAAVMDDDPPPLQPRGAQIKNLGAALGRRPSPPTQTPPPPTRTPPAPATDTPSQPAADPAATAPAPAAATPSAKPATRPAAARETRDGRPSKPPSPRSAATGGSARSQRSRGHTVFYVAIETNDQVRAKARQEDLTNAEIIFDAIEATRDELTDRLSPDYTPPGSGQLFARPDRRPGKKVQLSAIISDRNLAAIDTLVGELGAESRSHLVEVALTAYFQAQATQ